MWTREVLANVNATVSETTICNDISDLFNTSLDFKYQRAWDCKLEQYQVTSQSKWFIVVDDTNEHNYLTHKQLETHGSVVGNITLGKIYRATA